jgi:TetR/AcrR family transcriptional repressor of nem operon
VDQRGRCANAQQPSFPVHIRRFYITVIILRWRGAWTGCAASALLFSKGRVAMKVSREQAALNRERIVDVASRLFRERGYEGIGVADLMKSAGLTHGGFYGHFKSKEDLFTEACARGLAESKDRWRTRIAASGGPDPAEALNNITASYLSPAHRDLPGRGCTVAALGTDIARLDEDAGPRHTLAQGMRAQIDMLTGLLAQSGNGPPVPAEDQAAARQQAIARYASMVGAVVLARAVDDPALSDEILQAVAQTLRA